MNQTTELQASPESLSRWLSALRNSFHQEGIALGHAHQKSSDGNAVLAYRLPIGNGSQDDAALECHLHVETGVTMSFELHSGAGDTPMRYRMMVSGNADINWEQLCVELARTKPRLSLVAKCMKERLTCALAH